MSHEPIGSDSDIDDFICDLRDEAGKQGPEALREVAFAETYARLAMQMHEARIAKGITQTELARRSGVSQADISRIETAQNNPTLKTIVALALALDCDLSLCKASEREQILVGRNQAQNGEVSSLAEVVDRFKAKGMLPADFDLEDDETCTSDLSN